MSYATPIILICVSRSMIAKNHLAAQIGGSVRAGR